MHNRIRPYLGEPNGPKAGLDYYVVTTDDELFLVTRQTAESIIARLERRWPPRWMAFTTLTGSKVRLRTARIETVLESTAAQRAAWREFQRAQQAEQQADHYRWEDEND